MDDRTDGMSIYSNFLKSNPADADVIIIPSPEQARLNCEKQKKLINILKNNQGDDWEAIVILNDNGYYRPDPTKISLVKKCQELVDSYRLPVIAHWAMALAMLNTLEICWILYNRDRIRCIFPQNPGLTRTQFMVGAQVIMAMHDWQKSYLLL